MMTAHIVSRSTKGAIFGAVFAAVLAAPTLAGAQVPDAQSGIADPGRAAGQIRNIAPMPDIMPEVTVKELRIQEAPPGAENIRMELKSIRLEGVSAYSEADLRPVYESRLGQTITLADLYMIANELTRKYRNDGYILTQVVVPPQTIEGGNPRLQVVEGYLGKVSVQGNNDSAENLIRSYAGHINADGPLNVRDLERGMLLINDLPGVTARGVLSPSPSQAGAADLLIIVERDPFDALLSIDNYGSRFLGPVQLTAAGSLNNMLKQNERITAQIAGAPGNGDMHSELMYYSLDYKQPVFHYGTMLELFASRTDTEPGYTLEEFDVEGKSEFYSVGLEHPFIRSRATNLYGRLNFDWRDVRSENNLEPTRRDHIRAVRAGGRFEFLDRLLGVGVNSVDVEVSQGVGIFGASDAGDSNLSRPDGEPNFTKFNAEIQRLQRIMNGVNLFVATHGQWSDDPLLSSEEFGVGGVVYGRGYDPSEIVGDDGIAGKLELQWENPLTWSLVDSYQLYGFYDIGKVWNQDATTSSLKKQSLASTGFGIRTDFPGDAHADFMVAFPLTRDVETTGDQDARVFVSLSKKF